MSPVISVLLIASCDPSLLHCTPLETWHRSWETTQECRKERPIIHDRLTREAGPGRVILVKCRLFVDENRQYTPPPSMIAKNAPE